MARYDYFTKDKSYGTHRVIAGWAVHLWKLHGTMLLVDLDYLMPDDGAKHTWETKLTLQVKL